MDLILQLLNVYHTGMLNVKIHSTIKCHWCIFMRCNRRFD